MPELLTHVLVAYAVFRLLSLRYEWLNKPFVTVGMAGAVLPDVAKVYLLVPNDAIEAVLGLPFDWLGLHTIGGVIVLGTLGALAVAPELRTRILALLVAGALTHLALDAAIMEPSGYGYPALWPVIRMRFPSPNLYRSTDVWPAMVASVLAATSYTLGRRLQPEVKQP